MKEKLITLKFNDGTETAYNFKHDPFVPPFYIDAYEEAGKMIKEAIECHNQTTRGITKKTFKELSQIGDHKILHEFDTLYETMETFNELVYTYLLGEFSAETLPEA